MQPFYRSASNARLVVRGSGYKGTTSFTKLSGHDSIAQAIPDAMHTVKDAVVNLFDLITGRDDTIKCRECELKHGKRFGITESKVKDKISRNKPGVPYSLSSNDIKLADSRAESIFTPLHVDYLPG